MFLFKATFELCEIVTYNKNKSTNGEPFLNIINRNQILITITVFRLIRHQAEFQLVPNQSEQRMVVGEGEGTGGVKSPPLFKVEVCSIIRSPSPTFLGEIFQKKY